MASTAISRAPLYSPENVSVSFKEHGGTISVKWKNPYYGPWADSDHRYSYNIVQIGTDEYSVTESADGSLKNGQHNPPSTSSWRARYADYGSTFESATLAINRDNLFPNTSWTLKKIVAYVFGGNSYGEKYSTAEFKVNKPRAPKISASFNPSNGRVTFTVETNAGTDSYDRYDTVYWVTRENSESVSAAYVNEKTVVQRSTSTSTSFTTYHDVSQHNLLNENEWVKVRCYAYSRGMAGTSSLVSKVYMVTAPYTINIKKITADSNSNGKVNILLSGSSWSYVSSIRLQRLWNVTAGTEEAATASSGWQDVDGAVDNGVCTGFTDFKSSATPEVRKHTWYRVISTYDSHETVGKPFEAKVLYRARDAESADAVKWPSIELSDSGDSIDVLMGWATDSYTATEITWADSDDAWDSNEQPDNFIVEWEDASPVGYAHTARFVIKGLESGIPIYIRARRVRVEDGKITAKGEWCSPPSQYYPITPATDASSVSLYAPSSVTRGEGIVVTWDYVGDPLEMWYLYRVDGTALKVIASGSSPVGKHTIGKNVVKDMGDITLRLGITSGAGVTYSNDRTVAIYDPPALSVSGPSKLEQKPLSLQAVCNLDTALLMIRIVSKGNVNSTKPDGSGRQLEGDIVWHGETMPIWTASGNLYAGNVQIDADFIDGGAYTVEAYAYNTSNGLVSEMVTRTFDVDWSHKAPEPSATVTVDQDALSATVTPIEAESAADTDTCDIYRLSGGTARLVAKNREFGVPVTDDYAPFSADGSGLAYRIATRTADGDEKWVDVPYTLAEESLVVDFDGERLTLPWGVAKVDSWKKPFAASRRWDGSMPGYWDGGAEHTASLTTYIIEPTDGDAAEKMRRLAKHIGPCFVRLADGTAFAADVQVESYGGSMRSLVSPMSLSATEVDAGGEFMAREGN